MAENAVSSSQESNPLSQETFRYLVQQFDGEIPSFLEDAAVEGSNCEAHFSPLVANTNIDDTLNDASLMVKNMNGKIDTTSNVVKNEEGMQFGGWSMVHPADNLLQAYNPPEQIRPPASLPASENYEGDYSFRVSLKNSQEKSVTWIYSEQKNKLYVLKDAPVPINFSTGAYLPDDVCIRATALFSAPEHASYIVERCINHSQEEIVKGLFEAQHLIRCESKGAVYDKNPFTHQNSVVVPFENPAEGQMFTSYLYKFVCFSSCSGGPNRRALMVVFTLERGNVVIGRQKIHLKVCACPGRDYKQEMKLDSQSKMPSEIMPVADSSTNKVLIKRPYRPDTSGDQNIPMNPSKKLKKKNETGEKEEYTIKVPDKKGYEFLKAAKRQYYMYRVFKTQFPKDFKHFKQFICSSATSEDEGY